MAGTPCRLAAHKAESLSTDVERLNDGPYAKSSGTRCADGHTPEVHVEALAGSIKLQGMLVPLFVREHADGFELVAAFTASPPPGHSAWPRCRSSRDADTEEADRAVENITRKQLNPYEEAKAVRAMLTAR